MTASVPPPGEVEPNNDLGTATAIPLDRTVFANAISPPGDIDYFSFGAIAGNEYTITTSNLAGVDTIMDLVDAGFLGVAFNADAVPGFPESQII